MLLTDYLASVKPIKYDNSALFLLKMEGWMRLSRTDAAQLCAMNPASVTQLSNELMEAGLIRECGRAITQSGRKPVFLELAPQAGLCISLLMEGGSSRLAIHNLHHEIVAGATLPPLAGREDLQAFCENIRDLLDSCLGSGPLGLCVVQGDDAPQEEALLAELASRLREMLPMPVYAAGSVSMCCLSEGHLHYPDTHLCVTCLSVTPYQVRLGVMVGDQLLFSQFQTGSIGFSLPAGGRPPSPLKDRVNLKSLATGALSYLMTHPGAPFAAEDLLKEEAFHLYIRRLAQEGETAAQKLLEEYAQALSVLMYNTACQYAPSLMVVQGEVLSLLDVIGSRIQRELDGLFSPGQARPKIIASQLGEIAPLYGASRYVLRSALDGAFARRAS